MAEQTIQVINNEVKFNGNVARVSSTVAVANPEAGAKTDVFTRTDFEGALNKVSRLEKTPERA